MTASATLPPGMLGADARGLAANDTFRILFPSIVLFGLLGGEALRYSLSWWGFGAIAIAITTVSAVLLVQQRHRWSLASLPLPLLAFLAYATVSLAWSVWPGNTGVGVLITWMTIVNAVALAVTFSWSELLRALSFALRALLGLSLLFELVVSVFVRQPVLPLWTDPGEGTIPKILFWSRDLLFEGGRIQGIVGSSTLLAMIALLGVIVFGIQLALRTVRRLAGWSSLLLAVLTLALTRSGTVFAACAVVAFTVVAVLLVRRTTTMRSRMLVTGAVVAVLAALVSLALVFRGVLLGLLGKSSDLTGRAGIWEAVTELAGQRPWFGGGWAAIWAPWNEQLGQLAKAGGIWQLQAHNAWLDVWLQLGIVGLVIFGSFVGAALVKAWQHAIDRPYLDGEPTRFSWLTLLPLLILVAYLVQSIAESRLLIEGGLALLTIVAVKTRRRELV